MGAGGLNHKPVPFAPPHPFVYAPLPAQPTDATRSGLSGFHTFHTTRDRALGSAPNMTSQTGLESFTGALVALAFPGRTSSVRHSFSRIKTEDLHGNPDDPARETWGASGHARVRALEPAPTPCCCPANASAAPSPAGRAAGPSELQIRLSPGVWADVRKRELMGSEQRARPGKGGVRRPSRGWSACRAGGGAALSSASREGRSRDHTHRN
jgi:hypothetical protein